MHEDGKKMAKSPSAQKFDFGLVCKRLVFKMDLVGASGFEPPTSWSRTFDAPLWLGFAGDCRSYTFQLIDVQFLPFLNPDRGFHPAPAGDDGLRRLVARKGQGQGRGQPTC